ncbi:hypothetical protein NPIL_545621 [Nephila pilipes]|uniref:Uncharacterized protein n=1 Tax=Nephila pilipes TaxID=299642 RepID=A0A8X6N2F5_NEPPI|nr:hypothetical protein NPIL_545621 [Nephila pilipes]
MFINSLTGKNSNIFYTTQWTETPSSTPRTTSTQQPPTSPKPSSERSTNQVPANSSPTLPYLSRNQSEPSSKLRIASVKDGKIQETQASKKI